WPAAWSPTARRRSTTCPAAATTSRARSRRTPSSSATPGTPRRPVTPPRADDNGSHGGAGMVDMEGEYFSPDRFRAYRDEAEPALLPLARQAAELFRGLGVRATANDWLLRQDWKRALALPLYRDLLGEGPRRRVLEVGGGLSALTLALARRHDYALVEL